MVAVLMKESWRIPKVNQNTNLKAIPLPGQSQPKKFGQMGQSIIEVIIATGIVALVMTAIVAAITVSVKNTAVAKQKLMGSKLSQEGIEYFRQQRAQLGWATFAQQITSIDENQDFTACLPSLPPALSQLALGDCDSTQTVDTKKIFQRSADVVLEENKSGKVLSITITVTVSWYDNNVLKTAQTVQAFKEYSNTDAPTITVTNKVTADASGSYQTFTPDKAIDGDSSTYWSAGGVAPQWIHLDLKQPKTISTIKLKVSQSPAGLTSHDVYAGPDWPGRVLVKSFNQSTANGDQLVADFNPPLTNVQHVWVFSNAVSGRANPSPSWVSWYEIEAN